MSKIYRFLTFYELYDLLVSNQLKMTKLSLMEDLNEGLGLSLKYQDSNVLYSGLSRMHYQKEFIDFQKQAIGEIYISCWTKQPDSIAMWLLYSQDKSSIRVQTTVDKLEKTLTKFWDGNDFHRAKENEIITLDLPEVGDVIYKDFKELSHEIRKKYERFYDRFDYEKLLPNNFSGSEMSSELKKLNSYQVLDGINGEFIKDSAYSYEHEVRASASIGFRDHRSIEEVYKEWYENDENEAKLIAPRMIPKKNLSVDEMPDIIKVDVEMDFIETICFDPRMPNFKKRVLLDIFSSYICSLKVENSNAFGYAPDSFDFSLYDL